MITDNDEKAAALLTTPAFSNLFYFMPMQDGSLRVAFGERVDESVRYHTAVRVDREMGVGLRDYLLRLYPLEPPAAAPVPPEPSTPPLAPAPPPAPAE